MKGTVTDNTDQSPIVGAEVKIYQKTFNGAVASNTFDHIGTVTTDGSGFYTLTFERVKVTEFKIEIRQEGFFTSSNVFGSAEVTSDQNNVFNYGMDGMSWAKFDIQNTIPNDPGDNMNLIFYHYRTGCDGCIEMDYNAFEGIVDTVVTYTNTAGNYLKFTVADGMTSSTDSILMPFNDTVTYSINY